MRTTCCIFPQEFPKLLILISTHTPHWQICCLPGHTHTQKKDSSPLNISNFKASSAFWKASSSPPSKVISVEYRLFDWGHVWLEVLKFNKHRSTFILFDKKFSILD
jgi:hypothetical protein